MMDEKDVIECSMMLKGVAFSVRNIPEAESMISAEEAHGLAMLIEEVADRMNQIAEGGAA
jgi:hypothetical protein